jgi:hypothetical protein
MASISELTSKTQANIHTEVAYRGRAYDCRAWERLDYLPLAGPKGGRRNDTAYE